MEKEHLQEILRKHRLWLECIAGERADLSNADVRFADLTDEDLKKANLRFSNLRYADLTGADLRGADLRGADLDYSVFPLWCGSLDVKVDARIARQLAYHLCRLDCDDEEFQEVREKIKGFANKFHHVEECGRIE